MSVLLPHITALVLLRYPSAYGALLVVSNLVMFPFYSGRSLTGFHDLYNLIQLVMQWLSGSLVLILCIVKRGELSRQIVTKLGSSFSTVAFVIVVVSVIKLFFFSPCLIHVRCIEVERICFITKMTMLSLKNATWLVIWCFIFAGNLHHFSNGCHRTTCSTFILPYSSYQEGKQFSMFN